MRSTKTRENQSMPWWEEIFRGHRKDMLARSLRRVAQLSSWGYGAGVRGRQIAYQRGWLKVRRLPQPTICVGNITAGGTGKTPLVIRLASDLLERGLRPAVLLRGYRRAQPTRHPVLVRDPRRLRSSVAEAGDEAMELADRLPGACVGVGADRYAVGQHILKDHRVDCFILDDGFQHHRLDRDINIVTVDALNPWGGGYLLPAGLLRESPGALKRADAVVITRSQAVGPDRLSVLRAEVSQHMRPTSALLESRHQPVALVSLPQRLALGLEELRSKRILAVSGIGNPKAFEIALEALGAELVHTIRLPDHGGTASDVWRWLKESEAQIDLVVMTEKDAMRWSDGAIPKAWKGRVFALRMTLEITSGQKYWNDLLDLIRQLSYGR